MGVLGLCYISPPVSSRQEEKQRRREERLAREQAEKAKAARRKRAQIALGGGIGLAAIAAIVVFAFAGIGGDDAGDEREAAAPEAADVRLPEQQIGELEPAAEEAGCELSNPRIEGRSHEDRDFTPSDYQTNPPTSGVHFPQWSEDGVYETGNTPPLGMLVHTLEHGRINVQYKPGTPAETVAQLEALVAEQNDGYHMLLYENATGMEPQIAATAWGHSLTCPRMNDQVFDAIRTFTREYLDQGPEDVA
jgi:hypothetical protein